MASAKLAKTTVNHSQTEIWATNDRVPGWATNRSSVVTRAPTSVTNMTGFLTMWTGLSFLKLSPMAGQTMAGSNSGRALADMFVGVVGCGL